MQRTVRLMSSRRGIKSIIARLPSVLAVLVLTIITADAASVEVKDGNVYVTQGGNKNELTKSGKDADPALSPDGKWVTFTRVGNPESTGSQGDCKSGAMADELRWVRVDGSGEELLYRGHDGKEPKDAICDFSRKQLTSDGRYIYFLSPAWAVSAALHRFDTRTKTLAFVMDANDVIVLNDCKKAENRDSLVVSGTATSWWPEATTGIGCSTAQAKRNRARSAKTNLRKRCATRLMVSASAISYRKHKPGRIKSV